MHRTAIAPTAARDTARHHAVECLRARSRAIGLLAMSGFGALWAAGGAALAHAPSWAWPSIALLFLAFAVRAFRLLRANPASGAPLPPEVAERKPRAGRVFMWAFIGEGLGIFIAVNAVVSLGHPQWQTAVTMAIVGLHFLPLASAFGYRPHAVTGAAMTAWALAYPWLFSTNAPAGPLGAAAILFASAAWAWHTVSGGVR